MASSVFYKFSSRKDESRVTFDGTGISVFDLKRDIILANNMGKANDFDLAVLDSTSKQGMWHHLYSGNKNTNTSRAQSSPMIHKSSPGLPPSLSNAFQLLVLARVKPRCMSLEPEIMSQRRNPPPETVTTIAHPPTKVQCQNVSMVEKSKRSLPRCVWSKCSLAIKADPQLAQSSSTPIKSAATEDSEAAAMAAMFQAQNANWEETQEKMTQLVLPLRVFVDVVVSRCLMNFFFVSFLSLVVPRPFHLNSATRIYNNTRGTGFSRGGGKPHAAHHAQQQHQVDRPLPASYVCYRCGQKGSPSTNVLSFRSKSNIYSRPLD